MIDMTKKETMLYHIGRIIGDACPFSNKPICEFPCRICKLCRISKGCMGCIHREKKNKFPCTDYNIP